MRKTRRCERCEGYYKGTYGENRSFVMKRVYIRIGKHFRGIGWVCSNYPNVDRIIHCVLDEEKPLSAFYSIYDALHEKGQVRNLRRGHPEHIQVTEAGRTKGCPWEVYRAYIKDKRSWKPVGWFCHQCGLDLEEYTKEISEKNRRELEMMGVLE